MKQPQISVIIPVFNEEKNIGNTISLLRERSATDIGEIIVVDGGSKDKTKEYALNSGADVIDSEKKGRAAQMNRGAESASGDILYFLHADTVPPFNFDKDILKAVSSGFKAGCFILRFNDSHPGLKFYAWFTRFKSTLIRFGDQSLFVTKSLFEAVGGYDESLIVMEDQKIVRSIKRESPFKIIERPVITSARKYRKNGVFKLQAVFFMIWAGYYSGLSQEVLTKIYRKFIQ
jgi:rSAM/selenodomain-associated transferase 2